jgi:hypothetical protein
MPDTQPSAAVDNGEIDADLLKQLQKALEDPSDENTEQILKLLNDADQLASGVEGKLDALLDRLSAILDSIEPDAGNSNTNDPTPSAAS